MGSEHVFQLLFGRLHAVLSVDHFALGSLFSSLDLCAMLDLHANKAQNLQDKNLVALSSQNSILCFHFLSIKKKSALISKLITFKFFAFKAHHSSSHFDRVNKHFGRHSSVILDPGLLCSLHDTTSSHCHLCNRCYFFFLTNFLFYISLILIYFYTKKVLSTTFHQHGTIVWPPIERSSLLFLVFHALRHEHDPSIQIVSQQAQNCKSTFSLFILFMIFDLLYCLLFFILFF